MRAREHLSRLHPIQSHFIYLFGDQRRTRPRLPIYWLPPQPSFPGKRAHVCGRIGIYTLYFIISDVLPPRRVALGACEGRPGLPACFLPVVASRSLVGYVQAALPA